MFLTLVILLGGLTFFLLGIRVSGEALTEITSVRMRAFLGKLTRNRFIGLFWGAVLTILLQSSSAATILLLQFLNANLMRLVQALAVLLGGYIGTTFGLQLVAFNWSQYSLLLIFVGFLIMSMKRSESITALGKSLLGFGFIFYGMFIIQSGLVPLKESEFLAGFLAPLSQSLIYGFLTGVLLAVIFQSTLASLSIIMTLSVSGIISEVLPLVLGANVGTCFIAVLATLGRDRVAWKLTIAHVFFKLFGALVVLFLLLPHFNGVITQVTLWLGQNDNPARYIAHAHTIFNVILALVMLPFIPLIAKVLKWILPDPAYQEMILELDQPDLNDEEISHRSYSALSFMAQRVISMVDDIKPLFIDNDLKKLKSLSNKDESVDLINALIKRRLTKEMNSSWMDLLYVVDRLEHVGDIVSKSMVGLAKKKIARQSMFSSQDNIGLGNYHKKVKTFLQETLGGFLDHKDVDKDHIKENYQLLKNDRDQLHFHHLEKFGRRHQKTIETSSIFLDLISDLDVISEHALAIAKIQIRGLNGKRAY